MSGEAIRVRGLVQGVGFRPTVWRLARACGLRGDVRNDGSGVLIRVAGDAADIARFCAQLVEQCPPLARIDALERRPAAVAAEDFRIVASAATEVRTGVVADAATCAACRAEILDPANRRYRYPFTNCTHCGPRLSIVRGIPYDRANTSMSVFPMCGACAAEYADPADRRFHAQPNACHDCGPRVWLVDAAGKPVDHADVDAVAAASRLLAEGGIVALKGIGGFHLACDATNAAAVAELRARKRRYAKPFALMARDLDVIAAYAEVDECEAGLLASPAAPIVLLTRRAAPAPGIAPGVAPGQLTLGFMLPYSPLHHLLLEQWSRPLVMTSGNLSDEPQCIANTDAAERLGGLADYYLLHDREIVNRVDDSVVRVMAGEPRLLRRARGYAPTPIPLPPGFDRAAPALALGGELKNTVALLQNGQVIVSQHLGDLEDARTADEYERTIELYRTVFAHRPTVVAVDRHPDYRSTRHGRELAEALAVAVEPVQHHHAHIASVMADNAWPRTRGPVVGVALDGLGFGDDGSIWGGEFLLADYVDSRRLGMLRPVPMPGGTRAILEPWRNTYAQIAQHIGWQAFNERHGELALAARLREKPLDVLEAMLARGINSPLTSSCGRLFDAVSAALDVAPDTISYEGQAAIELEALALHAPAEADGYCFARGRDGDLLYLDPAPMWRDLLRDLAAGVERAVIAARFHRGLADAVGDLAVQLARDHGLGTVALSGGVLQNRTLFEALHARIADAGLAVLSHRHVPANDGGLSLGQAVVAAARALQRSTGDTGAEVVTAVSSGQAG
jgi:hydrogenase maturation protein HypF